MNWHEVATSEEVPKGEALQVKVEGEPVAIYNLEGTFYATHDVCTHAHAHLSDGYIEGDCVECPLHGGVFHIPSGTCRGGPVQKPLRVYPVKNDQGRIYVAA